MTEIKVEVKRNRRQSFGEWMDCHPRTGWWLAGIGTLNVFLNLLDLVIK